MTRKRHSTKMQVVCSDDFSLTPKEYEQVFGVESSYEKLITIKSAIEDNIIFHILNTPSLNKIYESLRRLKKIKWLTLLTLFETFGSKGLDYKKIDPILKKDITELAEWLSALKSFGHQKAMTEGLLLVFISIYDKSTALELLAAMIQHRRSCNTLPYGASFSGLLGFLLGDGVMTEQELVSFLTKNLIDSSELKTITLSLAISQPKMALILLIYAEIKNNVELLEHVACQFQKQKDDVIKQVFESVKSKPILLKIIANLNSTKMTKVLCSLIFKFKKISDFKTSIDKLADDLQNSVNKITARQMFKKLLLENFQNLNYSDLFLLLCNFASVIEGHECRKNYVISLSSIFVKMELYEEFAMVGYNLARLIFEYDVADSSSRASYLILYSALHGNLNALESLKQYSSQSVNAKAHLLLYYLRTTDIIRTEKYIFEVFGADTRELGAGLKQKLFDMFVKIKNNMSFDALEFVAKTLHAHDRLADSIRCFVLLLEKLEKSDNKQLRGSRVELELCEALIDYIGLYQSGSTDWDELLSDILALSTHFTITEYSMYRLITLWELIDLDHLKTFVNDETYCNALRVLAYMYQLNSDYQKAYTIRKRVVSSVEKSFLKPDDFTRLIETAVLLLRYDKQFERDSGSKIFISCFNELNSLRNLNWLASYGLGLCYEYGLGCDQSTEKANIFYQPFIHSDPCVAEAALRTVNVSDRPSCIESGIAIKSPGAIIAKIEEILKNNQNSIDSALAFFKKIFLNGTKKENTQHNQAFITVLVRLYQREHVEFVKAALEQCIENSFSLYALILRKELNNENELQAIIEAFEDLSDKYQNGLDLWGVFYLISRGYYTNAVLFASKAFSDSPDNLLYHWLAIYIFSVGSSGVKEEVLKRYQNVFSDAIRFNKRCQLDDSPVRKFDVFGYMRLMLNRAMSSGLYSHFSRLVSHLFDLTVGQMTREISKQQTAVDALESLLENNQCEISMSKFVLCNAERIRQQAAYFYLMQKQFDHFQRTQKQLPQPSLVSLRLNFIYLFLTKNGNIFQCAKDITDLETSVFNQFGSDNFGVSDFLKTYRLAQEKIVGIVNVSGISGPELQNFFHHHLDYFLKTSEFLYPEYDFLNLLPRYIEACFDLIHYAFKADFDSQKLVDFSQLMLRRFVDAGLIQLENSQMIDALTIGQIGQIHNFDDLARVDINNSTKPQSFVSVKLVNDQVLATTEEATNSNSAAPLPGEFSYYELGRQAFSDKEYEAAIGQFLKVFENEKNYGAAQERILECYIRLKKLEQICAYGKAVFDSKKTLQDKSDYVINLKHPNFDYMYPVIFDWLSVSEWHKDCKASMVIRVLFKKLKSKSVPIAERRKEIMSLCRLCLEKISTSNRDVNKALFDCFAYCINKDDQSYHALFLKFILHNTTFFNRYKNVSIQLSRLLNLIRKNNLSEEVGELLEEIYQKGSSFVRSEQYARDSSCQLQEPSELEELSLSAVDQNEIFIDDSDDNLLGMLEEYPRLSTIDWLQKYYDQARLVDESIKIPESLIQLKDIILKYLNNINVDFFLYDLAISDLLCCSNPCRFNIVIFSKDQQSHQHFCRVLQDLGIFRCPYVNDAEAALFQIDPYRMPGSLNLELEVSVDLFVTYDLNRLRFDFLDSACLVEMNNDDNRVIEIMPGSFSAAENRQLVLFSNDINSEKLLFKIFHRVTFHGFSCNADFRDNSIIMLQNIIKDQRVYIEFQAGLDNELCMLIDDKNIGCLNRAVQFLFESRWLECLSVTHLNPQKLNLYNELINICVESLLQFPDSPLAFLREYYHASYQAQFPPFGYVRRQMLFVPPTPMAVQLSEQAPARMTYESGNGT